MKKRTQTLLLILSIAAAFWGCRPDEVAPATNADFELVDSVFTVGKPVVFNNLSRHVDSSRFTWNFGDNTTMSSTDTNPVSHIYTSSRSFSVELIAYNKNDYQTSKVLVITVGDSAVTDTPDIPHPIAAFTVDSMVCKAPCTVQFTDASQDHDPSKNIWQLDSLTTNEGGTSFSHTYLEPGLYTVSLTVKNEVDSTDTTSHVIQVLRDGEDPMAIPNFTIVNNGCTFPCDITLINQSSGAVSFDWDFFDDGRDTTTTSVTESVPYSPTSWGKIPVRLTAYDSQGADTSIVDTIVIEMPTPPNADFEIVTTPCTAPCLAKFVNLTTSADSIIFDYDYNNIMETVVQQTDTFSYEYTIPGIYVVSLSAYKAGISTPSIHTDTIAILAPIALPVADFSFTMDGCTATCPIQFTELASNEIGYIWDFDDGSPLVTSASPAHTYTSAGIYMVELKVYNNNGDTASITKPVTINAPAPTGTTYEFPYGNAQNQEIWDVAEHPNGSYMMAGHTTQGTTQYGWLVWINESGVVLWDTVHRDANRNKNEFRSIEYIGNDEFVVAGFSESNQVSDKRRGWVLVVDTLGEEQHDNEVGYPVASSQFQQIYPTPNGRFVAVGRYQACDNCVKEGWIVELTSDLVASDTIIIGTNTSPFYEGFFNTVHVNGGYAYIGGHAKTTASTDDWDAWVVKYDFNSNAIDLDTLYGDAILAEDIWDVAVSTAGNLVFCGNQNDNFNQEDLWLMEITPSGVLVNQETFPQTSGNSNSFGITRLSSGDYGLTGYVKVSGLGEQLALFTVDNALSNATLLNEFGSTTATGDDRGRAILPTSDGGYFMGGFTNSLGSGGLDGYYIRTDLNGIVQ